MLISNLAAAVSVGQHIVLSQPRPNKGPSCTSTAWPRSMVFAFPLNLSAGIYFGASATGTSQTYPQPVTDQVASDELSRRQDCGIAIGGLSDLASWRTWTGRDSPACAGMDPREEVAQGFELGSRPCFVQGQGDGRLRLDRCYEVVRGDPRMPRKIVQKVIIRRSKASREWRFIMPKIREEFRANALTNEARRQAAHYPRIIQRAADHHRDRHASGRHLSLVKTKLEEACMFAVRAVLSSA
jgi:hypothetical protein